ncbi:phosphoglycolate phosphatase [Lachnospiraceae bacterium KH1T2]|jgi:phosphoglycolate phosphatase|nr:phosphoglycolate phosphatase [Lachnospiraceae bacterium KH1T2]
MKTDGIILDVDGTIWNSTGIVADAWNKAAIDMEADYDTISAEMLKAYFGKTMEEIAAGLFSRVEMEKRHKLMRLCERYEQEYLQKDECHIVYEGVKETIAALSKKVKIFVVSNCQKGYIELMLEKTGMEKYVTDTECYGNTGNGKADNIRLLAERNSLKAPLYVGDTDGDAIACEKAGVPFIFASYGFGNTEKYVEKISKFEELTEIID